MAAVSGGAGRAFELARRGRLLRALVLCAAVLASLLALTCGRASALSGTPIKVGEGATDGPPAIAVDAAGTAYVAWAGTSVGIVPTVYYCVIPARALGCSHSGELAPDGGGFTPAIFAVDIVVDGSSVAILAEVGGTSDEETEPLQEWLSTDGGATFREANGGLSVSNGRISADTAALNAVIVPGTGTLGVGWVTAGSGTEGTPSFSTFALEPHTVCAIKPACAFADLQPSPGGHALGNPFGQLASIGGPGGGVLGVYETHGPPGCASGTFDTAYVFGSGEQSASNSYDISPDSPKTAWRKGLSPADCEVEYPAVGGGPSGFGVLEDDLTRDVTVYHPFDQPHEDFDTPYTTVAGEFEESPSVSQDGAGGVYATFLAGAGGPVRLAYSNDGGAAWSGPATIAPGGGGDLSSSVGENGQGWATWMVGTSTYVQQFDAADSVPPETPVTITTVEHAGTSSAASLTIKPGTTGETDQASIAGADAGTATGTVTYALYSSSSCAAASKVFDGGTHPVGAGTVGPSAPVSAALAPGTYLWQAVYSGNPSVAFGARGNLPGASACGGEVLTVSAATGAFVLKRLVGSNPGTITIEVVPGEDGTLQAEATVPTASIAAVEAKSKKCKHGQIRLKGHCVPAETGVGKAKGKGTEGVRLKLTIHLSGKISSRLAKGRTEHLTVKLSYQSAFGGKPTIRSYSVTIKGRKRERH